MKINIPRIFANKEVYIVATGESLKGFDFDLLKNKPVIAVCKAKDYVNYDLITDLDLAYTKLEKGKYIVSNKTIDYDNDINVLSLDYLLRYGNNSGFTALAVAFELGATKVNLLGFDVGWKKQRYFYGHEEKKGHDYYRHLKCFDYFKNHPVINWSKDSLIECFQKKDIIELVEYLKYDLIHNNMDHSSRNCIKLAEYIMKNYNESDYILDIGCGDGKTVNFINEHNYYAKGLDISLAGIKKNHLNFIETPIWQTGLKDNEFDYSFSTDVLEHIPTGLLGRAFDEIERITRKKSVHFINTENGGVYYNQQVHLTVKNINWWKKYETSKIKLCHINEL